MDGIGIRVYIVGCVQIDNPPPLLLPLTFLILPTTHNAIKLLSPCRTPSLAARAPRYLSHLQGTNHVVCVTHQRIRPLVGYSSANAAFARMSPRRGLCLSEPCLLAPSGAPAPCTACPSREGPYHTHLLHAWLQSSLWLY